jgi:hypothetical protein
LSQEQLGFITRISISINIDNPQIRARFDDHHISSPFFEAAIKMVDKIWERAKVNCQVVEGEWVQSSGKTAYRLLRVTMTANAGAAKSSPSGKKTWLQDMRWVGGVRGIRE